MSGSKTGNMRSDSDDSSRSTPKNPVRGLLKNKKNTRQGLNGLQSKQTGLIRSSLKNRHPAFFAMELQITAFPILALDDGAILVALLADDGQYGSNQLLRKKRKVFVQRRGYRRQPRQGLAVHGQREAL